MKSPAEVISDKMIMFIEVLPTSNPPRQIDHKKCNILTKDIVVLDVMLQNYFKDSLLHDVICGNCSSDGSESIKPTFTVSIYIKEPPTVLKILFQRGSYDSATLVATKNELEVTIPSEYIFKQPSSNYKMSYTLVLLINYDGDSLDCGNYVSDVFDSSTGIWWHCDDDNITEISDFPKGVYYRETHERTKNKKELMQRSTYILFVVYIRTTHLTKHRYNVFQEFKIMSKSTLMKKVIDEQNLFRSEVMVRKEVNDEIKSFFLY